MLSEIVSSQGNNRQIEKAGERRGTFDDIVPIDNQEDDAENLLQFEPVEVEENQSNNHQAGQGLRRPQCDEEIKDEYSERLSNEQELDLTTSKNFFTDKQIKSSRRYLIDQQEADQEADFENIKEVDHTDEIE